MISRRLVLFITIATLAISAGDAFARPRARRSNFSASRNRIKQQAANVAGQVKAAENAKAAAQLEGTAERVRANDASNRLSNARGNLDGAHSESKVGSEERREIETQILAKAGPDHPANRAKVEYEHATAELKRSHAKALNSASWQAEKLAAEKAGRSRQEIDALEADMLGHHSDYFTAKARYEHAASEYRHLRHVLFSADARWNDNVSAGRRLQADQSEASRNAAAQARRQINADARAKDADRTAAAADATIQQGQARLNQLQQKFRAYGGKKKLPGVTSPAVSGKGSKSSK